MDAQFNETSQRDLVWARTLRFTLGVTACVAIAFALRWPLFHLAPVFTAFFLAQQAPILPVREAGGLFTATLVAYVVGLIFSHLLLPYPLVYITLLGLTLFRIYYWVNRGGTPMLALLPLAAVMILPMISLNQGTLAHGFLLSLYFMVSAGLAVVIFLVAHIIVPDPEGARAGPTAMLQPHGSSRPAAIVALKSTTVVLPIAALFMGMNWASELSIIVFVAILSLSSPEAIHGRSHGLKLLTANLIGGGAAVFFYLLIVAVPEFEFFVVLTFLTMLAFGSAIFVQGPQARYAPSACLALLILIGASMTEHAHFIDKPLMRVVFVSLAALYVVVTLAVLDRISPLAERISGDN